MIVVTDCLGRTREPANVYPDGSFNCPFCMAAVTGEYAERRECPNPACFARAGFPADRARALLAESERRAAEEVARKRNHEQAMERARIARDDQANWEYEQIQEAKKRGACLKCLFRGYRTVKFVKHRKGHPHLAAAEPPKKKAAPRGLMNRFRF